MKRPEMKRSRTIASVVTVCAHPSRNLRPDHGRDRPRISRDASDAGPTHRTRQGKDSRDADSIRGADAAGIAGAAGHAVQLIGQHPALTFGSIFEIRPAGDMSEIMKASEQRRSQNTAG